MVAEGLVLRSLQPFDKVLIAILAPLWLVCFILHVEAVARDKLPPLRLLEVWVTPGEAGGVPKVRGFRSGAEVWPQTLEVGDELVSVGGADLRGVGAVGLLARTVAEAGPDFRVKLVYRRDGALHEADLPIPTHPHAWRFSIFSLGLAVMAFLIFLRSPDSEVARPILVGAVWYSLIWCPFPGGPPQQTYAWVTVRCLA